MLWCIDSVRGSRQLGRAGTEGDEVMVVAKNGEHDSCDNIRLGGDERARWRQEAMDTIIGKCYVQVDGRASDRTWVPARYALMMHRLHSKHMMDSIIKKTGQLQSKEFKTQLCQPTERVSTYLSPLTTSATPPRP